MRRDRGRGQGRGRWVGAERRPLCASLVPRPPEGAQGRGVRALLSPGSSRGVEPGPSGQKSTAPPAIQEGEDSSGLPLVGFPGARVFVLAPPARRRRPPPGAAGSRRAGMPPLLAPLLCLVLLPALGARGRRPPTASPQLSAPFGNFGSALLARPEWLGAGGQGGERGGPGVPGRGWVGRGTTGVQGWGRTDPIPHRLPTRGELVPPAPGAGFEAGVGR